MQNKNIRLSDLQDSQRAKKEMKEPQVTIIDLPEVANIPSQENSTP